jgi:hypothetical protein
MELITSFIYADDVIIKNDAENLCGDQKGIGVLIDLKVDIRKY